MELLALVYRNLKARPVRSLLTLLGIVVATASMVLFLSFGEGIRGALAGEVARVGPTIQVVPQGSSGFGSSQPEISPATVDKIKSAAKDAGALEAIPVAVLMRGGFDPGSAFIFQGLPAGVSPKIVYPGIQAEEGSLEVGAKDAVLGSKVAQRSGVSLGKELRLSAEVTVKVTGILKESGGFADNFVFVANDGIQKVLGTQNFSSVLLVIKPGGSAESIAQKVDAAVPGVDAQTTGEVVKFMERAVRIGDIIRFGISLVALIVGGLLVANTVMMGVYERIREFGLMRAIGAKRSFIFGLVLLEALLMGLTGGLVGLVLGGLGSQVVNWFTVDAVGLPLSKITFRLAFFALSVATTLGLIAGVLPARTASRIPVVEALGRV